MISLVYVSRATDLLDDEALESILLHARERNTELGITGILVYRGGRFVQMLEGPADAVEATLERIRDDPRHQDVVELDRNETGTRWFPDWSMAFEALSEDTLRDVPGFRDFFGATGRLSEAASSSQTKALLHWFRRHELSAAAG